MKDNWMLRQESMWQKDRIAELQRQLAEVTRERDTLKAMLDLQNLRAERANLGSGK